MDNIKWLTAEVTGITDETPFTRRFFLRVPELDVLPFKPGQFITLDLPISEKKTQRLRSYSIASAPQQNNELELVIVHLPGGAGTDYFWQQVGIGSLLKFKGPSGIFTLPASLDGEWCICCNRHRHCSVQEACCLDLKK